MTNEQRDKLIYFWHHGNSGIFDKFKEYLDSLVNERCVWKTDSTCAIDCKGSVHNSVVAKMYQDEGYYCKKCGKVIEVKNG